MFHGLFFLFSLFSCILFSIRLYSNVPYAGFLARKPNAQYRRVDFDSPPHFFFSPERLLRYGFFQMNIPPRVIQITASAVRLFKICANPPTARGNRCNLWTGISLRSLREDLCALCVELLYLCCFRVNPRAMIFLPTASPPQRDTISLYNPPRFFYSLGR